VMMRQRHQKLLSDEHGPPGPPLLEFGVEALTDHIVGFSLAGMREVRRQIESGRSDGRP